MALRLDDKWVWDFWFAVDGDDYHIFYLQADKSLGNPDLRHWNVSIGHAVSIDLTQWTVLADALCPSHFNEGEINEPADTCTTWTGSIFKQDSTWYMYYTATKKSENGLVQRVCLATSSDLIHWHKHEKNPLVELDSSLYDGLNLDLWHDASWRDPWVIKDPVEDIYHMYVTCRVNVGEPDGRGAVGYAYSRNLIDWTVSEPLFAPGCYGEMEVPQIEKIAGRYYLFCSVSVKYHSKQHLQGINGRARTGLKYYIADQFDGPYSSQVSGFLGEDEQGSLYSGKVIQKGDGDWYFLAFVNTDDHGNFVGEIIDPIMIKVGEGGELTLDSDIHSIKSQ
jgi:beta-fructofuranosidase